MAEDTSIGAQRLLEFSVGLGVLTLVATYIVSTIGGRVAPFIPIISEMPFAGPESSFYGPGLAISIFSFILLAQVFHRIFTPLARELGGNYESWNDLIRIIATFGGVCGIIAVNFHWIDYPILHGVTAGIVFTSFLVWGTFAWHLLQKSGRSHNVRKYAVYSGWLFYSLMIIFSGLDSQKLIAEGQGPFHRLENPPSVDDARSLYLNLTAFCEWGMVFSFYVGALTFRQELEGVRL